MNAPARNAPARLRVRLDLRPRSTVARMRALKAARPVTRGDCVGGIRACPYVTCRHHLLTAQKGFKSMTDAQMMARLESMPETCSLDVADRMGEHLETVGLALDLTRERVRQLEEAALEMVRELRIGVGDFLDTAEGRAGRWHDAPHAIKRRQPEADRRRAIIIRARSLGMLWAQVATRLTESKVETRRGIVKWYAAAARAEFLRYGLKDPLPQRTPAGIGAAVALTLGAVWPLAVRRAMHAAGLPPAIPATVIKSARRVGVAMGWQRYEVDGETIRCIWAPAGLADDEIERLCGARPKGADDE